MDLFKHKKVKNHSDEQALSELAQAIICACGGKENIKVADACITRLRFVIHEANKIQNSVLEALGAKGIVLTENNQLQLIFGKKSYKLLEKIEAQYVNNLGN